MMRATRLTLIGMVSIILIALIALIAAGVARADFADQRTTELLTALQAGNFTGAEKHFDATMKAGLPPEKLESVWKQITSQTGPLESFNIAERTAVNGIDVGIADLHFERSSGLTAQVAVNSSGLISGLFFKPATARPEAQKLAEDRINQMLQAIRDARFDRAEEHFDETMKSALPPAALEDLWKQKTASLGALTQWRIVGRAETDGVMVRIVNLDFATAPKAFALKLAVNAAGQIAGLFFIDAVAEPISSAVPYLRPASFTSRTVSIGSGERALGGTLTVPGGAGPFPAAVLVHGSGPQNRDEDILANHPFKDIADLSSDGIVVLRYDKRTWAHPGTLRPVTVDTETIDDAVAAVTLLRSQPEVNRAKVFVIGHSLGAGLAPEIATRAHADGVVMLAPPGMPVPQTIVRQLRYLHAPPAEISEADRKARLIMARSLPPADNYVAPEVIARIARFIKS